MKKNILIPTDFSDNAKNAICYALSYFAARSVHFYLLHVNTVSSPVNYGNTDVLTQNPPSSNIKRKLQNDIRFCKKTSCNKTHKFLPLIREGSLIQNIRNVVSEHDIDYIMMGTKGSAKYNDHQIGSTSYEVITKVKCPTIIIPELARHKNFRHIGLPTDFNNLGKNRTFDILNDTLALKNADLHILQLFTEGYRLSPIQEEHKNLLMEFLSQINFVFYYLPNKNIDREIERRINELGIDLITIVGKNLNLVQRLLARPKKKNISYHLKVPFLVLHE